MQYISLAMSETLEGCCTTLTKYPSDAVAKGLLLDYTPTPHFSVKPMQYQLSELEKYDINNPFLHPMEDYGKRYDVLVKNRDKAAGKIIFKQGKADIDMSYADNQKMMAAMEEAFRVIENDSNASLKKIVIAAFASPEGTLAFNTKLAASRGEAVKQYFISIMQHPDASTFEIINGREDWSGLRNAVESSDMMDKEEVLKIIDGYTINQEVRKIKLKQLDGGAPYKWMLENLYPPLRNGGYLQIFYEVQRKAAMSWTDENHHQVWIDPESPRNKFVTAYNKTAAFLVDGKYDEAIKTLLPYGSDSRTWNYLGVAYMMKNDNNTAALYFEKAKANGDPDAAQNLEELKWNRKADASTGK
jgi:outer membrane protein OmpA-like peptidoglycan-associated protein